METIGDLLSRDLNHRIEEVIQVHQADEQSVYSEVSEYVATTSIQDQYALLLKAIAEAPAEPHEAIGVWISVFFGSGKSSFAKNLGYALKNPKILNDDFARLFKRQVADDRVDNLLDLINAKIPTEVILFEVAKEKDTRRVTAVDALHRGRTRRPVPQAQRGAGRKPPEEPRQQPLLGVRTDPGDRRPGCPDLRIPQDGREVRPDEGTEQDQRRRGDLPPGREDRRTELRVPAPGQADGGDGAGHWALPGCRT